MKAYLVLVLLLYSLVVSSQEVGSSATENRAETFPIKLSLGVMGRTWPSFNNSFRGRNRLNPFSGFLLLQNMGGIGLNIGVYYSFSKKFEIAYSPNIRYDKVNASLQVEEVNKSLLIDNTFSMRHYFPIDLDSKNFPYISLGYSFINHGKTFEFVNFNNPVPFTAGVEFRSINLSVGVPFKVVYIEPTIHFFKKDELPELMGLRIYYIFSWEKK